MSHPLITKNAKKNLIISIIQSFNLSTLDASNVQTTSSNNSLSCTQPWSVCDFSNSMIQKPTQIINNSATYLLSSDAINSATADINSTNFLSKQSGAIKKHHTEPSLPLTDSMFSATNCLSQNFESLKIQPGLHQKVNRIKCPHCIVELNGSH